jgi:hypothetical protein
VTSEFPHSEPLEQTLHPALRFAILGGLLICFTLLIWNVGRAGLSSLLSSHAASTNQVAPADAAVDLSQDDPDANYLRATILGANNDLVGAITEYNQAVSLRPEDYVLWLSLARARALNGDTAGALAASQQAVNLAPYYAQPRWQLGNLLLRAGEYDEAFKELRLAGASSPKLLPAVIDLAGQLSHGDPEFVQQSIQSQAPETYLALAQYFRKRGAVLDAIGMFGSAGDIGKQDRASYLAELTSAKRFQDAYALWLIGHATASTNGIGVINDAGFEQESNLDEPGFGWRTEHKVQTVTLLLDTANPKEGKASLRVEFRGDSDPDTGIISQLVMVEPNTRYRLLFAARTDSIVSGGPPRVVILDAGNKEIPGQTVAFPESVSNWQDYYIDFGSHESTGVVQITLQRERCSKSPCPIFGRLWLDNFSFTKL